MAEGDTVALSVDAFDSDEGTLAFSAMGLPPGLAIDSKTGSIIGTPPYDAAGTYTVTREVVDDGVPPLSAQSSFTIEVTNTNRQPVLEPIGNRTTDTGAPFSFLVRATDPDSDNLSFSAEGLPDGASLMDNGDGTAEFSWQPLFTSLGDTVPITLTVFDDGVPQALAVETFSITVVLPPRPGCGW